MFKERYQKLYEPLAPSPDALGAVLRAANAPKPKQVSFLRKPAVIVALILACVFTAMPVLAANVEPIYQLMYLVSPDIAQFFMPVKESCEDNGIRMEVISSYIHDNNAEIYVTMQDLTGDRVDETTDLYDSYYIHRPFDSAAYCERVGYDAQTKTATFLIRITEWGNQKITGDKITFGVREFLSHKQEYENIEIPLSLADVKPATQTQTVNIIGGGGFGLERYLEEDPVVLVPGEPDSAFPIEGIELTGIGYLDGKLHIQTAVENPLTNDNHGFLTLIGKDGSKIECDLSYAFTNHKDGANRVDYDEYLFDVPFSELQNYKLYGDFVTSSLLTQGNWRVTFPLNSQP